MAHLAMLTPPGHRLRRASAIVAMAALLMGLLTAPRPAVGMSAPESMDGFDQPLGTLRGLTVADQTPRAPTEVWVEDFENRNAADGARRFSNITLGQAGYQPRGFASGQRYTGSAQWIDATRCNGLIASYGNASEPSWAGNGLLNTGMLCAPEDNRKSYEGVRTLARVMGQRSGRGDAESVLSAWTECRRAGILGLIYQYDCSDQPAGGAEGVMLRMPSAGQAVVAGRYYSFGVDSAATNCQSPNSSSIEPGDPRYQFSTVSGSVVTAVGGELNGCRPHPSRTTHIVDRPSTVQGGGSTATGYVIRHVTPSVRAAGTTMRLQLHNNNGATSGNDSAVDNIRLLDATPTLSKSFAPSTIAPGETSRLTLAVTNTTELSAKGDWSFTDTLPSGVRIAAAPAVGGTCQQRTGAAFSVGALAGGTAITVTGGDLAQGEASCTITVDVTSSVTGSHTNGASNITDTVLRFADPATLTVTQPTTMTLRKDIVARVAPSDQFRFVFRHLENGSWVDRGQATTSGTTAGIQPQGVGPFTVQVGDWHWHQEYMASGSASALAQYDRRLQCSYPGASGGRVTFVDQALDSFHFSIPEGARGRAIECLFANTPAPATMTLEKEWDVNGQIYAHGSQPPGLEASPRITRDGSTQAIDWSASITDLRAGSGVQVDETVSISEALPGCSTQRREITTVGDRQVNAPLPHVPLLLRGENRATVRNTVQCENIVTLLKTVVNDDGGMAGPADFDLTARPAAGDAVTVTGAAIPGEANTLRLPAGAIELSESGRGGYVLDRLERYTGDVTQPLDDSSWEPVDSTVTPALGTHQIYRFVNADVAGPSLPLTGGMGVWAYGLYAAGLLAAALLLSQLRRRRTEG